MSKLLRYSGELFAREDVKASFLPLGNDKSWGERLTKFRGEDEAPLLIEARLVGA